MVGWANHMRATFGASFLWLVSFVYFTQGFRSFVWAAVSYQLKDILKLSPSASQFVVSAAFFPWSIKPFYGILSDCIPIGGRKRVPYLVISTILSLFPWVVLGLISFLRNSHISLTILLTLQNFGSAMADVVIDAMIAEAVRSERAAFAGDLQSLSWSAMAFGGVCGSLLGGFTLSNIKIGTVFLLFSVLPTIQLLSCAWVDEVSLNSKSGRMLSNDTGLQGGDELAKVRKEGPQTILDKVTNESMPHKEAVLNGNRSLAVASNIGTIRGRKIHQKNGKRKTTSTKSVTIEEKNRSLSLGWFVSLKSAFYSLGNAFRQPIILRPMAWFFLSHISIPNLATIMFYYQTEVLHLDASFLGTARVIGWFGLMLGTFIYNRYLKRLRLRRMLMGAHIGLGILNFFDVALVARVNVRFGISDKLMVLCGSALSDAVNQFKMMPFLVLSGQLCPPGIEGTLFALFMSINNLGSTLGSFFGAALASMLNISSQNFDNLLVGIIVQLIATFIPILFLFLIPKEATGLSA
uniref:5'-methylthioadenosine/S-adenosylhomocysteine nucleosidase n=1 Tax=Anthurium amnicola TaxID=1678845 RepID=A0A1D1YWC3_9ARAE